MIAFLMFVTGTVFGAACLIFAMCAWWLVKQKKRAERDED